MKIHVHSDSCRFMVEIWTTQCKNQSIIERIFLIMIPIQRVFTEYQCFQNTNIRNIIKEILIFSFPLSVGIAVTVLSFNVLGEGYSSSSGPWCWIKDCEDITKLSPVIWMVITGKLWEVLTYLGIFAIYLVLIILKVKRHRRSRKVKTNF